MYRAGLRRVIRGKTWRRCESTESAARRCGPPRRPVSQASAYTHAWYLGDEELAPGLTASDFAARRKALAQLIPSTAVFPAAPQRYVTGVVPYPYRACSTLRYLSSVYGSEERDGVLVVENGGGQSVLFLAERDAHSELWDGPRLGASDEVGRWLGVAVRPRHELQSYLRASATQVLLDTDTHPAVGAEVARAGANVVGSPVPYVDSLRMHKCAAEIALMRAAARATSGALNDAMAQLIAVDGSGVHERDIAAVVSYSSARRGGEAHAFPSVVAGGANATVLHYMANLQRVGAGQLVMVDAGCQVQGYVSDVSRTWPVNGRFTPAQHTLYQLVLNVHKTLLARATAGVSQDALHALCATEITRALLDVGFMRGSSLHHALHSAAYMRYFPHATGHFLGMDVHDTHQVAKSTPLQPGMAITIEPGVYVPQGDPHAPPEYHGIGIRIEDDVIVMPHGQAPQVLSDDAVKEIDDIEHLVGSARTKWTPL